MASTAYLSHLLKYFLVLPSVGQHPALCLQIIDGQITQFRELTADEENVYVPLTVLLQRAVAVSLILVIYPPPPNPTILFQLQGFGD